VSVKQESSLPFFSRQQIQTQMKSPHQVRFERTSEDRRLTRDDCSKQKGRPGNERPSLLGRIVPTGQKTVKTFWQNLMSRKRGVSRNFWEINIFVFNKLENRLTELFGDSF
jgi:hypothetical protein